MGRGAYDTTGVLMPQQVLGKRRPLTTMQRKGLSIRIHMHVVDVTFKYALR